MTRPTLKEDPSDPTTWGQNPGKTENTDIHGYNWVFGLVLAMCWFVTILIAYMLGYAAGVISK